MRSCGYAIGHNRGEEIDFMRRLTGQDYPRYHIYIKKNGSDLIVNLHIDQKKPSYQGAGPAHGGEYEGELIREEINRINISHQTAS